MARIEPVIAHSLGNLITVEFFKKTNKHELTLRFENLQFKKSVTHNAEACCEGSFSSGSFPPVFSSSEEEFQRPILEWRVCTLATLALAIARDDTRVRSEHICDTFALTTDTKGLKGVFSLSLTFGQIVPT